MELANFVDTIPDFPKAGIAFKDITPLLRNPEAYRFALDRLEESFCHDGVQYVAGIESRGFLFASALADRLNSGLIPIRKSGRLPGDVLMKEYELEYGTAELEIRRDCIRPGERVLIVDDVLATGGTATCAASLFNALNVQIVGFAFLISLSFLKGEEELAKYKTVSLVRYE